MVALNIPGGWTLTVYYDQMGQRAANVLGGMEVSGGATLTNNEAQAWLQSWWGAVKTLVVTGVTCVGGVARQTVPDGLVYELDAPTSPAGGVTGSQMAAYSTLLKWNTTAGGRGGRGRTYVPGLATAKLNTDGRTLQTAHITTAQTAIDTYLSSAAFSPTEFLPAIISQSDNAAHEVTSGVPAQIAGIQRRRMR